MKKHFIIKIVTAIFALFLIPLLSVAQSTANVIPSLAGIRIEFVLFALTLVGVAVFHNKTMYVALCGLFAILIFKFSFDGSFNLAEHIIGTKDTSSGLMIKEGEWRTLINLMGLLFGFALLARHFEDSGIPDILPKFLPDDWKGGFVLLFLIMFISSFLDNIAAAMIGGAIALIVFKGKVHLGFLAAIVAASNAGGAGSVLGDTTTTLMWIDGVNPVDVLHAFVASIVAFFIFGFFASKQQHEYQPIEADPREGIVIDYKKVFIVLLILISAIITNIMFDFPALGVWIAIIIGSFFSKTPWNELKNAWQGSIFLMALVLCASLMPVNELPPASIMSAFILGFVSAVFDNIPLTKLCLEQGGYDWGVLAYAVGFGGSMIWFGSSAGVALSNMYPEAKDTLKYISKGWHVILAYIVAFYVMIAVVGWHPHKPHKKHDIASEKIEMSLNVK
ncbi:MAG: citrate transporter [Bacteroidetes bacterium]|nr:citrate transporter [Bacteroidota bacterium]